MYAALADAAATLEDDKADTVVFWSENRPEWVVAFWGCLLGTSRSASRSRT